MTTQRKRRSAGNLLQERPAIDFLILADRAEGLNGKLYLMGGGWTDITIPDFAQPQSFSLAIGVLVPWNATNEEHLLRVEIETDDGTPVTDPMSVKMNMGRPATAAVGQEFRAIIAVNGSWKLPGAGRYRITALVGEESRKVTFRALAAA